MKPHRHIEALQLAHACVELGARLRTIECVSGIGQLELRRIFFSNGATPPCGRQPASEDWLFERAKVPGNVEAAMFAVIFHELTESGVGVGPALIGAYRLYQARCRETPRVSFDRAFDIVCCLRGIWSSREVRLALTQCETCASRHLVPFAGCGTRQPDCPFCELLARYHKDRRLRTAFQTSTRRVDSTRPPQAAPRAYA
ncbi:FlhC family transcriptional regulator [Massilia sp. TS11]|uniref:FlhC family transcriptional regulator n=1 Tax=Massilia sp. TS11 TaxID=2908003 RepID=UPI001EDC58E6|nr:FlhC family transcriptional regulator [Massilia sp. TS11]MCG2583899.1 flagellar transcriptional regulator FlhC [Massilia sp. TS11]